MTLWPQHAMFTLARRGAARAPRSCDSAMCPVLHISLFLRDGEEQAATLCASISSRAHMHALVWGFYMDTLTARCLLGHTRSALLLFNHWLKAVQVLCSMLPASQESCCGCSLSAFQCHCNQPRRLPSRLPGSSVKPPFRARYGPAEGQGGQPVSSASPTCLT